MLEFFKIDPRKLIAVLIGNILIGLGIGVFKYSHMGNDPFSAMAFALNALTPISYAVFLIMLNTFIFIFEFVFGKKYIHIGTIINWFLVGYVVQFTYEFLEGNYPISEALMIRLIVVVVGLVLASLGISLYQTADMGVAPFDSLPLIIHDKFPITYFWARMIFDGICVVIAFVAGGLIGIGTLVCVLGFGPIVSIFNKMISEKLIPKKS